MKSSNRIRQQNEAIVDNFLVGILRDVFKEGYALGKDDKTILNPEESDNIQESFNEKVTKLKEIFCYGNSYTSKN